MPGFVTRLLFGLFLLLVATPALAADTLHASAPAATATRDAGHDHDHDGFFTHALESIKHAVEGDSTWAIGLSAFFLAFAVGTLHSMQPGHGKTLVAAYLVGVHGTIGHAVLLGLVVTLTHTLSVIVIGGLLAYFSGHFLGDSLQGWLGTVAGILLMGTGLWLLLSARRRLALRMAGAPESEIGAPCGHDHGSHSHPHHELGSHTSHGHGHVHEHGVDSTPTLTTAPTAAAKAAPVSLPALISLGIAGGIVPCLDAVLIVLAAISFGRLGFGFLVILGFSLGIASVLILFGILLVKARSRLGGNGIGAVWMARMPVISAMMIIAMGLLVTATGISNLAP